MAHVAIHARVALAMAVDAPAHRLIYFAPNSMQLANLTVTSCAVDSGSFVRLVREEYVGLGFKPVHPLPRRLFLSLAIGRELLDLRGFRPYQSGDNPCRY